MSFFRMGTSALDEAIDKHNAAEAARASQQDKPWRFWLKAPGTKGFKEGDNVADIIFLDDEVPVIYEHHLQIDGKWGNFFTCLTNQPGVEYCPLCDAGDKPYEAAFYPIIDRREYSSRKGDKVYKDQIRLLVAKPTTIKQLRIFQAKLKTLKGREFNVTRTGREESNVGNTFIATETHSKADVEAILREAGILKEDQSFSDISFDRERWTEILQPLPAEDLEAIVGKKKNTFDEDDKVDFS